MRASREKWQRIQQETEQASMYWESENHHERSANAWEVAEAIGQHLETNYGDNIDIDLTLMYLKMFEEE